MDLWIRSQDKENLIQPTRLFIAFDTNIATWDRNTMVVLGKYSTKERALEVLDEINRHIEELHNCKYGVEYDLSQFTYEMPED